MKIFDLLKRHGIVTRSYPFAPYEMEGDYRGMPVYNYELCIGCAACGVACPPNAIKVKWNMSEAQSGDGADASEQNSVATKKSVSWVYDCGRCIFCSRCDEVCPTGAIRLGDQFELSTKLDREALLQTGELAAAKCSSCGEAFAPKRLTNYALQKLEAAGLTSRIEAAKKYTQVCQKCKRDDALKKMIAGEWSPVL